MLILCLGGSITQVQYTQTTRRLVEAEDGLLDPSIIVPRTIKDAMDVSRAVGIDYLWVDSLCILQDDADDVAQYVSRMGHIYSGAAAVPEECVLY